jgi:excisionase family DNA binding protein
MSRSSVTIQPRLLTIAQAAVYLGRTEKAAYHMVASGQLPAVRSDSRVMLDRLDLDAWIEANKR